MNLRTSILAIITRTRDSKIEKSNSCLHQYFPIQKSSYGLIARNHNYAMHVDWSWNSQQITYMLLETHSINFDFASESLRHLILNILSSTNIPLLSIQKAQNRACMHILSQAQKSYHYQLVPKTLWKRLKHERKLIHM